jgi:hypothetical protein
MPLNANDVADLFDPQAQADNEREYDSTQFEQEFDRLAQAQTRFQSVFDGGAASSENLSDSDPVVANERAPRSIMGHAFDILARGQYASAALVKTLADDGFQAFGQAVKLAGSELVSPNERYSYRDVLKTLNPKFVEEHPVQATLYGLIGDIALDPTTYLTFGYGAGTKLAIKGGTTAAQKSARRLAVKAAMDKTGEMAAKKGMSEASIIAAKKTAAKNAAKTFDEGAETYVRLNKKGEKFLNEHADFLAVRNEATKLINHGMAPDEALELARRKLTEHAIDAPDIAFAHQQAYERMGQLLGTLPEDMFARFTRQKGLGFAGKEFLSREALKKVGAVTGLARLNRIVREHVPFVEVLKRTFNRNHEIPETLLNIEKRFRVEVADAQRKMTKMLADTFGDMNKASRLKLGRLGSKIHDDLADLAAKAEAPLTAGDVAKAKEDIIESFKLTDAEHTAFVRMQQFFKELGETEVKGELLDNMRANYFPRFYKNLEKTNQFFRLRNTTRRGFSEYLSHNEALKFRTLNDAVEAGYKPVEDAAVIMGMRALNSYRARSWDSRASSPTTRRGSPSTSSSWATACTLGSLPRSGTRSWPLATACCRGSVRARPSSGPPSVVVT